MAISAASALLSTVTTAVTGGTMLGGFLIGQTVGTMVTHFLVTTAMGAVMNALTPKPSTGPSGYNITTTNSTAPHQIIYGKSKCAGVRVFDTTTGSSNKFLHRVLAFAGHEVDSFEEIYFNDELVTLDGSGNVTSPSRYDGKATVKVHLGAPDQVADADLVSEVEKWTNNHKLSGIAYLYVKLEFNKDAYPNGVPEITAVIKGKKVYDPRDSGQDASDSTTWLWSANSALCIRDYLTNSQFGLGESSDSIDDTLFSTAANVCDYYNYPTLTGDARYEANGIFLANTEPYQLLNQILSSMGGLLWYAQGKWRCKPAYWTAPVLSFTEDDLRSSISVSTRHSRRDNFNTVNGIWRGADSNWEFTDFPPVVNTAFIAADNGQELSTDLTLPFTSDVDMGRRIANIYLERNRQQLTVMASFGMRAFKVQVGDNINLTVSRFGWVAKEFEVVSWTFGLVGESDLQVHMTLREISESVFDDIQDGVVYERDNTTLPSPFFVTPVGIAVSSTAQISNQKITNIAVVTVSAGDDVYIDRVEVEYKLSSSSVWKAGINGPLGAFEIVDLEVADYDFRARAVNTFGVRGDWDTITDVEINPFSGPPSDVTDFEYQLSGGTIFFQWDPVVDPDLSHYELRYSSALSGATWDTSSTVIQKIARPGTAASLPARSGTFLIKSYDKEGLYSTNATSVTIQPSELPALGTTDTVTEDPSFSGSKTNVTYVSNSIEITNTGADGIYNFNTYIDTGTTRSARATGFTTFERRYISGGSPLWDYIPQNWDTWSGNFDNWSDEDAPFGDTRVVIQVSATPDDPAGSPTWGSWFEANGSSLIGRAFRFRAILESTSQYISPGVLTLSADVEY